MNRNDPFTLCDGFKEGNNQKKVFLQSHDIFANLTIFFLLAVTFFDLQGLAGLSSTNCDSGIQPTHLE